MTQFTSQQINYRVATFLSALERTGNRLPHPTLLFFYLCLLILLLSKLFAWFDLSALHPLNGKTIVAVDLISREGLHKILSQTVSNFTQFAPLGTVLVAMLGIGIAEQSGLLQTLLRVIVLKTSKRLVTFSVVFAGVLSSLAADSGYVALIPLSAAVFLAAGKHPIAGIAAAFAGVSGGFSANLMIGPLDAILAGISTEAVHLVNPNYEVTATGNYYFIVVSTFLIALLGTWVTEKLVIPYLGEYKAETDNKIDLQQQLNDQEKRGLLYCGLFTIIFVACICVMLIPENGLLRNSMSGSISNSPFIKGIVVIISLYFALAGLCYGHGANTLQNKNAVIHSMEKTMETMASYLVLMFFAAQFVNYFSWTQLGLISAIQGSELLKTANVGPISLIFIFTMLAASLNLLIGSASAKWAIMAPVFVPMLYLLGISPEATQIAFRIGDSCTNIITPLMPYFGLVIAFVQRYNKQAGMGTMIATMLPYSICFFIGWSLLLIIWITLDLPLGPGATLFIQTH